MATTHTAHELLAPTGRRASRIGAWLWFVAMVGGWITFYAFMLFDEPALHDFFAEVRGLPLVLEGLVWLVFFPFVLALAFWTSGWDEWLRFALAACCAIGWSLAFYPWRRER